MNSDLRERVLEFRRLHPGSGTRRIAESLGVGRKVVRNILEREVDQGSVESEPQPSPKPEPRVFTERGDTAECRFVSRVPIKTEADALAAAEIDVRIWYVASMETSHWTTTVSDGNGGSELVQNYRIHLKLKRIAPKGVVETIDAMAAEWKKSAPKIIPRFVAGSDGESVLALIAAYDVHFGRLSWAPETGESCDLKITEDRFRRAIKRLVSECWLRNTTQIVCPAGSDFFQVDSPKMTTVAGTPQDVDGRYAKVFESGLRNFIWAIEEMLQVAPVYIPFIPGNHDATSSYHLVVAANAYFSQTPQVVVDYSPNPRKYYHWGTNLIGMTHGNEEKTTDLPLIMATERPLEWANSTCREWSIGHVHRKMQWVSKPVDTHTGVVVRSTLALAGSDAWHSKKGFVGATMGAECYFYGHESGFLGSSVAKV